MRSKKCKCGHKKGYHSQSSQTQKFVCRGAFCGCVEFIEKDVRTGREILENIRYEEHEGVHTFTMCKCGRQGCRGSKCVLCLNEEFEQKDLFLQKEVQEKKDE